MTFIVQLLVRRQRERQRSSIINRLFRMSVIRVLIWVTKLIKIA